MFKPSTLKIWRRKSKKTFNFGQRALFHLIVMACFMWGGICNYLSSFLAADLFTQFSPLLLIIAYAGFVYAGGRLLIESKKPLYSLFGYSLIVLPFSWVSAVVFGENINTLIQQVIFPNLLMIVVLGILNIFTASITISPKINVGISLGFAVLLEGYIFKQAELGISFLQVFLSLFIAFRIGFYWSKARLIPPIADNAIDAVGACAYDSLNPFYYIDAFDQHIKKRK